jgi:hypothetical protein
MTRVGSYELYQCPKCAQVHTKPNYSSISISIPRDAWFAPTDLMKCKRCEEASAFSEYIFVGSSWRPPGGIYEKGHKDPRFLYPPLA